MRSVAHATDYLSDVTPIEDFDQKYPILHVDHLIFRDPDNMDVAQALIDTIAAYDQTRELLKSMTATEVMSKIDEYMLLPINHMAERREILHSLARQGLTVRTILNLIPGGDDDRRRALAAIVSDKGRLGDEHAEKIIRADEMMAAGCSRQEIKDTVGVHDNQIRAIERWRACSDVGYEGAMKWAFGELMGGRPCIDVYRELMCKFSQDAAQFDYNTVYSLTRPARLERNLKRFGWLDGSEQEDTK
jgi:hypothetical protein